MATEEKDFCVIDQHTDKEENIYKLLMLKNEMKVMLIHERNSSNTSVALDVHIGNYSNLDDFPGLAHLCQRMIISEIVENEKFQKLVHHSNYYFVTASSDHSTYYFDIFTKNDSDLEQVLDHLVQFFYTPSFNDSWIEKKIWMMDSEVQTELQKHESWFQYFERSIVKSIHPYSKYRLCKKEILGELTTKTIQFRLKNFFSTHYSANIMTMCIVSGCAIDKIEKTIVKTLCQIKNLNIKIPEVYEDPFKDRYCTKWYLLYIVPKSNIRNLRLIFPLPNMGEDLWRQAVNCIRYYLESNHKNSLLEELKIKHWCCYISSSGSYEAKGLNFFDVVFTLSSTGCGYYEYIIAIFFEHLNLFKNEYLISSDNQLLFRTILQNIFESKIFQEEQSFTEQKIIQTVNRLHEYSFVTDILYNKYSTKFDHTISMIKEILNNYVCPRNIRVYLTTDPRDLTTDDDRHLPTKISPGWDNAHYKVEKIDTSKISEWTNLFYSPSSSHNLEFWPNLNDLLFYKELPEIIEDTSLIKTWYIRTIRKSNVIKKQSKMFFYFISPHAYENPLNTVLNAIYVKLIKYVVHERKYFHEDVLQWRLKNTKHGILLTVTSYVSVPYVILSRIISKILILFIRPTLLRRYKHRFGKYLESFVRMQPINLASYYISCLSLDKFWTQEQLLKAHADVTIDQMEKFIENFIGNMYIKCLMFGDIQKEQVLEITKNLEINWKNANNVSTILPINLPPIHENQLEENFHSLYEVENKFNEDSCIQVYYQIGKETIDLNSKLSLVHYIMSKICSTFFQKLNDSVKTCVKLHKASGIRGLIIIVFIKFFIIPEVVEYQIQEFISHVLRYIRQLSKEDFEKYKTNLIIHSKEPELDDITDALSKEDFTELYYFDQQETEKRYIERMEQKELVTFYEQNICVKKTVLSLHVLPKSLLSLQKMEKSSEESSEKFSIERSNYLAKPKFINKQLLIKPTIYSNLEQIRQG